MATLAWFSQTASGAPGGGESSITLVKLGSVASGQVISSISPTFGQPTTAGNLLIAWVAGEVTDAFTTTASGWVRATTTGVANSEVDIWYKANCSASETAPTFTQASGNSNALVAQLGEFSGASTSSPLDTYSTSYSTGNNTATASNIAPDTTAGELVLIGSTFGGAPDGSVAVSLTDSAGSSVTVNTSTAATGLSDTFYYLFGYAMTSETGSSPDSATTTLTTSGGGGGIACMASFLS